MRYTILIGLIFCCGALNTFGKGNLNINTPNWSEVKISPSSTLLPSGTLFHPFTTADQTGFPGCLEYFISDVSVAPNEEFCVEVSVNNFVDLQGFQGSIRWNPNLLEFIEIRNENLPAGQLIFGPVVNGTRTTLWFGDDPDGASLPDGTVIFEICFRAIGDPGNTADVFMGSSPTVLTAVNGEGESICINSEAGEVIIAYPDELGAIINSCGTSSGNDEGSLSIEVFGGAPPYTVSFQKSDDGSINGSGSIAAEGGVLTFSNLPATPNSGVHYEITILDSDGEEVILEADILAEDGPQILDFEISLPSCHDSDNGTIVAEVEGTEPLLLEWSNFHFDTVLSNIGTGTYGLTVTDSMGCSVTDSVDIEVEEIILDTTIVNALCTGVANGSITVQASGGTPINGNQYRYRWEGRSPQQLEFSTLSGLEPGTYSITVTDDNGCTVESLFEVGNSKSLTVENVVIQDPSCPNSGDGVISLDAATVGNEVRPYIFIWEDDDNNTLPSITFGCCSSEIENLNPGTYFLTLLDNESPNRCTETFEFEVEGADPIEIQLVSLTNESCDIGEDGSIIVDATGGEAFGSDDYTFNWSDGQTGNEITGLSAGDYTVTVTDLNNCEEEITFTISEAIPPTIDSIDVVGVSCSGDPTGELTLFFTEGSGSIVEISWEDEDANSFEGANITGLEEGEYTVTIISNDGCSASESATIEISSPLTIESIEAIDPLCAGDSNGMITVVVSGGGGALNYNWSAAGGTNGQGVITDLPAGIYSVTVSDEDGNCDPLEIRDIVLTDPEPIEATFIEIEPTSCHNTCDGQARVLASGGDPSGDYFYLWEDNSTAIGNDSLCRGINSVVVGDGNCSETFEIEINSPEAIDIEITELTSPTCFGEENGRISILGTGGAGSFSYEWASGENTPSLNSLTGGDYEVVISDANNCSETFEFNLASPDSLVVEIDQDASEDISCAGRDDGQIALLVSGGNGLNEFSWTDNVSDGPIATGLSEGLYEVVVTDQNGCSDTTSRTITNPEPILFDYEMPETIPCFGDQTSFTVDQASGGSSGPFRFSINFGNLIDIGDTINLFAGNYVVSVFDIAGCSARDSFRVDQPEEITISMPNEVEFLLGDSILLNPDISSPFPIVEYDWIAEDDILNCYDCPSTIAKPLRDSEISLFVTDNNGCQAMTTSFLKVNAIRNVYTPNAFSPNNDGVNDIFRPYFGAGVSQLHSLSIFNRWGSKVYERVNIPVSQIEFFGWDGTFNGENSEPGTYIYMFEVEFIDGAVELYRGEVALIR